MKKLILSVVLATAALAVQAGGDCCAAKQQTSTSTSTCTKQQTAVSLDKESGCCEKTQTSMQTKAECPYAKAAKANKQLASKQPLKSPKAIADAGK